jgi:O-antigen/teichoic acid export membrane protein
VDTSANQLAPVLLAGFFGHAVAGQFALVHRVLKQPTALLGLSLSQAFLAEATEFGHGRDRDLPRFALATLRRLFLLALVPVAAGVVAAPWVFAEVFGEPWSMAGRIAQILLPLYFALFLYAPFHQVLTIYERQHLHLLIEGLRLAAVVGLLALGALTGLGLIGTFTVYSAGVTATYGVGIVITIRLLQRGGLR